MTTTAEAVTLSTLSDNALLDVLAAVPPECFYVLENTCKRLYSFLRSTTNVKQLLRSKYGKHLMAGLAQYPLLALMNGGEILTAVLNGPKPSLIYIQRYLEFATDDPDLGPAAVQFLAKSMEWYQVMREAAKLVMSNQSPFVSSSWILARILDNPDAEEDRAGVLKNMLETEDLPLVEFFTDLNTHYSYAVPEDFLFGEDWFKSAVNLPDILPRVEDYATRGHNPAISFVRSIYMNASATDRNMFDRRVLSIVNYPATSITTFINFTTMCPNLFAMPANPTAATTFFHQFRYALHKPDLPTLTSMIAAGYLIPLTYLATEFNIRTYRRLPIEGICHALGLFLDRYPPAPDSLWCTDCETLDKTMANLLFVCCKTRAQEIRSRGSTQSDYLEVITIHIQNQTIGWKPPQNLVKMMTTMLNHDTERYLYYHIFINRRILARLESDLAEIIGGKVLEKKRRQEGLGDGEGEEGLRRSKRLKLNK